MSTALPAGFAEQVAALLGPELPEFLASFDQSRLRGLRFDPRKITGPELSALLGWELHDVPWCAEARLLGETGAPALHPPAPGRHPAHLAGLFYLQEPAATAAVAALDPQPGWRVLDVCAAPGGKTTQLSSLVGPSGLVVANEVVSGRLRALHDNLDRWGAANVVTTSLPVERLGVIGSGFDGVLLDAPCSGEALFRRDRAARDHWSPAAVAGAARRQDELLAQASALVRPGGVLVYSTCTFNRHENEDRAVALLDRMPGWELDDLAHLGASPGVAVPSSSVPTARTARLWPHRGHGEGQFVARFRRPDPAAPVESDRADRADRPGRHDRPDRPGRGGRGPGPARMAPVFPVPPSAALVDLWARFQRSTVPGFTPGPEQLVERSGWLFARPPAAAGLVPGPVEGIQRPGLPLGRSRPGRFEPHPALAVALHPDQAEAAVHWGDGQAELDAYLRGETVAHPGPDGWVLVCYHRWPLGWARRSRGVLKNAFPPHLRRQALGLAPRS